MDKVLPAELLPDFHRLQSREQKVKTLPTSTNQGQMKSRHQTDKVGNVKLAAPVVVAVTVRLADNIQNTATGLKISIKVNDFHILFNVSVRAREPVHRF